MTRIIVTGGSGFVGSAVASDLARRGHEIAILDVTRPRTDLEWIDTDLLDSRSLVHSLTGSAAVCHLAAVGDVYEALKDPARAARVNVEGTTQLLQASVKAGVRRFVYASTWEVYGPPTYQPIDEKHPCSPDHPYSITKLAGDQLVRSLSRMHGLQGICLRLGTAYGPHMRESTVFMRFVKAAVSRQPILVNGTGSQFRQFTHVSDIASAFDAALRYQGPEQTFNIVSSEKVTIRRVAETIANKLDGHIQFAAQRVGEPPSAEVSSKLAQAELQWKAVAKFEQSLDELVTDAVELLDGRGQP